MTLIRNLKDNLFNIRGSRTTRRIIVFESDDWGAIRMPSKEALRNFNTKGFQLEDSVYKYDCLESDQDLTDLFDLLSEFKGGDDKKVIFTANVIMANPNFEKIKEAGYREYYFEHVFETLKKYPQHKNVAELWREGSRLGVFRPQLHGREHVQFTRWLNVLRAGEKKAIEAFRLNSTYSGIGDYSFMESFDWDSPEDIDMQMRILNQACSMFEETFGYKTESFIAPCYNWDSRLENVLKKNNIKWIQGMRNQLVPTGEFGKYKRVPHFFGQKNENLKYNVRNCFFEPSMNPNKDWVDSCLAQINSAFLWKKPAIICSHRINYMGFIEPKNKYKGLGDLKLLLTGITKKWPDAIFITTDELDKYIIEN